MIKDLKKSFNKIFTSSILTSVVFIALGVFLLVKPDTTIKIISYTIGSIIILLGAISLGKYFAAKEYGIDTSLVYSILCLIVGLIIILNPTTLASIFPFVLGFWMVLNSIIKIQYALNLKNYDKKWVPTFVIGILILIWGLILVFNPFAGAIALTQMIGIFIIIYSILDLSSTVMIKKNIKDMGSTIDKALKNPKIIEEEE